MYNHPYIGRSDPPEPVCCGKCRQCNQDIVEGDDIITFDDNEYHEECFQDIAVSILLRLGAVSKVAENNSSDQTEYLVHEALDDLSA